MTKPWFAGIPPVIHLKLIKNKRESFGDWAAWQCLTEHDAHRLLMLIEVEALRLDMEVHLFASEVWVKGPGMDTPAWTISARVLTGEWHDVQ